MLVSVIIPCFNVAPYLERAVESILKQDYKNIEIWLIDNNSTDQTPVIIGDYVRKYPELIKSSKEYQQGAPAARNHGLFLAKGEWIQFMDADDELLPQKISNQLNLVINKEEVDVVIGSYRFFTIHEGVIIKKPQKCHPLIALFISKLGNTNANLWRKERLLQIGGWNQSYDACQEYELMSRLVKENNILFDESLYTNMYQRKGSISYRSTAYSICNYRLRTKLYPTVVKLQEYDAYKEQIERTLFFAIKSYAKHNLWKSISSYKKFFPSSYNTGIPSNQDRFYRIMKRLGFVITACFYNVYYKISKK